MTRLWWPRSTPAFRTDPKHPASRKAATTPARREARSSWQVSTNLRATRACSGRLRRTGSSCLRTRQGSLPVREAQRLRLGLRSGSPPRRQRLAIRSCPKLGAQFPTVTGPVRLATSGREFVAPWRIGACPAYRDRCRLAAEAHGGLDFISGDFAKRPLGQDALLME